MEEEADRDRVRKKINGLRVAHRRELNTVTDSTKPGARKDKQQSAYTDGCKTYYTIPVYTTVFPKMKLLFRNTEDILS